MRRFFFQGAGLERLDNLCKLMEELSALREQNSCLQRRLHTMEELQLRQRLQQLQQRPSGVEVEEAEEDPQLRQLRQLAAAAAELQKDTSRSSITRCQTQRFAFFARIDKKSFQRQRAEFSRGVKQNVHFLKIAEV